MKDIYFLVAPVRSGSTFLRLMLNSHPGITNPGECDFLFDLVSDNGDFPEATHYKNWLATNRIFNAKSLEINSEASSSKLIESFVDQMQTENSCLIMNVHRHFHRIPHVFPQAKYIHLLRDPRDVARSAIGMGWVGHVYFGTDIWLEAETSWERLKSGLNDDQYIEIKYEEILEDVEKGLTRICDFLDLEYTDKMLDYINHSTYKLPDKALSYQWKRKYSKRELQLVEGKLESWIEARDYELSQFEPVVPSLLEKIRLMVTHKIYRMQFQVQRYGLRLFLERLVSSRIGSPRWQASCKKRISTIDLEYLR